MKLSKKTFKTLDQKYFKDDCIPGGTITVSEDEKTLCPECKCSCKRIEKSSPEITWKNLCGRSVAYIVCPKCEKIILQEMSMN